MNNVCSCVLEHEQSALMYLVICNVLVHHLSLIVPGGLKGDMLSLCNASS